MVNSHSSRIALGTYDFFRRTPSLEIQDGQITFRPGRWTQGQFDETSIAFPPGARVEYRVQKGDMYFTGDHGQALARSLWVIEPGGNRKLLASGFILYIDLAVAARNLKNRGVPFRAVSFYEAANGEPVETEISTSRKSLGLVAGLLLVSSNLWLGAIAGLLIRSVACLIGIGTIAFLILAAVTWRSATSRKAVWLKMISTLPVYAAAYAVAVVLVRLLAKI